LKLGLDGYDEYLNKKSTIIKLRLTFIKIKDNRFQAYSLKQDQAE